MKKGCAVNLHNAVTVSQEQERGQHAPQSRYPLRNSRSRVRRASAGRIGSAASAERNAEKSLLHQPKGGPAPAMVR